MASNASNTHEDVLRQIVSTIQAALTPSPASGPSSSSATNQRTARTFSDEDDDFETPLPAVTRRGGAVNIRPNRRCPLVSQDDDFLRTLQDMLKINLPKSEIARKLNISRTTLYKLISKEHLNMEGQYSDIPDNVVDDIIKEIKSTHPAAGEIMVQGHLISRNIRIQRKRIRESLHRIDSAGIKSRSLNVIRRRVYSVPGPNFLWHIDGTHKLIRWRLVFHMGIDGFSRTIIFGQCSNNNRATTVLTLFEKAIEKYGTPLRIRTDHGGENICIWERMHQLFSEQSHPVIAGKSVHNQRVERLHRDVNNQVANHFYNLFYKMEEENILNVENVTDLFCLHYVFVPLINERLKEFILAHNNHKLSTEQNQTPLQLFYLNYWRRENHHSANFPFSDGVPPNALNRELPHVSVPAIISPLTDSQHEEIKLNINPLLYDNPIEAYKDTVQFVTRCMG